MAGYRFGIGDGVLCNMGPDGWKSGRIVALDYREDGWPSEMIAPYQVILDEDHTLIYVPDDDDRCCREASEGEVRITKRMDALAPLPSGAPFDTTGQPGLSWNGAQAGLLFEPTVPGLPTA